LKSTTLDFNYQGNTFDIVQKGLDELNNYTVDKDNSFILLQPLHKVVGKELGLEVNYSLGNNFTLEALSVRLALYFGERYIKLNGVEKYCERFGINYDRLQES
jgi:hypothetical protein